MKKSREWHLAQLKKHMDGMFAPSVIYSHVEGHLFPRVGSK